MKEPELKFCQNCESGRLHFDIRDVTLERKALSISVPNIAGLYCDSCDEIEFDNTTDSAERFAAAGDQLVLQGRMG